MSNPIYTGIVSLKDFPEDIILVGIKDSFKKELFNYIKPYEIAHILKTKPSKFYNLKNNDKVTIKFLFTLTEYLFKQGHKQFSYENVEKNIEIIGTKRGDLYIKHPKLPFNFNNEEGAYFISAILFDGGIDRQFKPHYGNIYLSMRLRIIRCAKKIFGDINSNEFDPKRGPMVRFPKSIGVILNRCFKIGIGNKIYHNNKVPDFIFNLNKKYKGSFLRQAFDDDGSISREKKLIRILAVSNIKEKYFKENKRMDIFLLDGVKQLLIDLGIESNPTRYSRYILNKEYRKKGKFYRYYFEFSITGRRNLEIFYKTIGFNLQYKMEKLELTLKDYKERQLRKGEINKIALEHCIKLRNNLTIPKLAKSISRSYRQTVRVMRYLEKNNIVKIKRQTINIGGKRLPAIYEFIYKDGKFI